MDQMEQERVISQDRWVLLEKNTKTVGTKYSRKPKRKTKMKKEKNKVFTVLVSVTTKEIRDQYNYWCSTQKSNMFVNPLTGQKKLDERLLDCVSDDELVLAAEVVDWSYGGMFDELKSGYIASLLNLIMEQKQNPIEEE